MFRSAKSSDKNLTLSSSQFSLCKQFNCLRSQFQFEFLFIFISFLFTINEFAFFFLLMIISFFFFQLLCFLLRMEFLSKLCITLLWLSVVLIIGCRRRYHVH